MKVTEELINRINENVEGCKVEMHLVKKNNVEKEGLMIIAEENINNVYPTIYVDDLDDFYDVLKMIESVMKRKTPSFDMDSILTREYVLSHLRATLVSKDSIILEQKGIISRTFLDMKIIYRVVVTIENEIGSILVNDGILKHIRVSEKELFDVAKEYDEYEIENLFEVVLKMTTGFVENSKDEYPEIYLISSKDKHYGASVLFANMLEEMIKDSEQSYYIIPSSVHEIILIPYEEQLNPEKLVELVRFVNATEVAPEDKLTDSVYYIDKDGIRKVA